jgi:hypothetical protein
MAGKGDFLKFGSVKTHFFPQCVRSGPCLSFYQYFNHLGMFVAVDDGADFKFNLIASNRVLTLSANALYVGQVVTWAAAKLPH